MAPPTKHKTPEAKLKAGREKRRQYYEKCRDAILAQRQQSRKDKKKCQSTVAYNGEGSINLLDSNRETTK
ncbi:hypothetical protein M405DRAFT_868458 [Rhizopogon salebrosus TDB-379]|nr:hypothetical protein M405DRAFT_868458 [Rhizopogon salebrosus TDB-379]